MASSSMHSTASLTVPSTQNTALVLEFRCLYTHDLRRKSKRWQDGFLRFHTFNKRVMVYDVPRNYIGDTHWREDEVIQDGDEMQLDRGALIQVGECLGSTEQDLSALLERRKPAQDGSLPTPASPRIDWSRSTAAPLAQIRPKSLNALLGTPQGRYGRCILPTKSPFDGQHPNGSENWEAGRATKRQRLAAPLESPVRHPPQAIMTTAAFGRNQRRPGPTVDRPGQGPRADVTKHKAQDIIIVESDDEPSPIPHYSMKSNTEPRITTTAHPAPRTSGERPVNPLRLASRKPRKKLLYKDLLPQRPPGPPVGPDVDRQSGPDKEQASTRTTSVRPTDVVDDLGRLSRSRPSDHCSLDPPEDPTPSITHSTVYYQSKALQQSTRHDEPVNRTPISLGAPSSTESFDHNFYEDQTFNVDWPSPNKEARLELSHMDQILLRGPRRTQSMPTSKKSNPTPPKSKPDNIVLSNANLSAPWKPTVDPTPQFEISPNKHPSKPPPLHQIHDNLVQTNPSTAFPGVRPRIRSPLKKSLSETNEVPKPKTPPPKRSLKKTVSDMTESHAASTKAPSVAQHSETVYLEPWSREAFDLFGWRPPGKGAVYG
ncbi:hypothetical protein MMC24_005669 [Lignoscripta atroalba]|nr:hypothetical protein [Lignoscripta atroalba]